MGWQEILDDLLDLFGLNRAPRFSVMNAAVVEVVVGGHKGVLVVDGDVEALHGVERFGVALVDARVGRSAGVILVDRGGRGPD